MNHDQPTAGYDPLAAPPRDGDGIVKWPVLAQLPWVGDESLPPAAATGPADILPFADSSPRPFMPPTFVETEAVPEFAPPQLRIVDPALPQGERFVESFAETPAPNRRLHAGTAPGAAEPPHIALHRMPMLPADDQWSSETAAHAAELPLLDRRPREQAGYEEHAERSAPAKQYRRFDPPQPRRAEEFAFQHRNDTFAAQFYEWHTSRKPQMGLIAAAALLLAAGGVCVLTLHRGGDAKPRAATVETPAPIAPVARPIPVAPVSTSIQSAPAANDAFAAPLTAAPLGGAPPLDLSTEPRATDLNAPPAVVPPTPTNGVEPQETVDPIAEYLNAQPMLEPAPTNTEARNAEAPTAQPHAAAKVVQPTPEVQLPPAVQLPQPVAAIVPPVASMPTPTPAFAAGAPQSASAYPTTPYPPLDFSLVAPQQNSAAPAVAGGLGPAFGPPQPPR